MFWNCQSLKTILQNPKGPHINWAIGHIGTVTKDGQYTTTEDLGVVESRGTPITAIPSLFMAQLLDRTGTTNPSPAAAPTFTPPAGTYSTAQSVTISSATAGASIRYTLDGTNPSTTEGTLYSSPVAVNATSTLKAIAYVTGSPASSITSGSYTITQPPPNILVTGVTVAPTTLSLNVNATGNLAATVAPANATNKTVSWSTSAPAIATVTSTGVVSAVATGNATITVTTQDGGFRATCEVTVTSTPPGATPITIPFVKDGVGDFYWVFSGGTLKHFNSWNLAKLEINGVDYTNKWSETLPPAIDGKYYVRYIGNFAWSHFEIVTP
jgi:uncharacterized protein YjdB